MYKPACKYNGQQLAGLKTAISKNKHDVTNKAMQDQITQASEDLISLAVNEHDW